jgi:cell division protein FtsB
LGKKEQRKKLASLFKERERIDREINALEKQLVKELCLKKGKTICEPEYCTFRYTDTCPFLKEWRKISKNS